LHSKLIIRKKYEDPEVLTSFFQKSQIFTGFPFFSLHADSNNDPKNEHRQEKEASNPEDQ